MDGKPQVSNWRLASFPVSGGRKKKGGRAGVRKKRKEKKTKKPRCENNKVRVFSLLWENFCEFTEPQRGQRLPLVPSRSQGSPSPPAPLGAGRGQSGLRTDDFQYRTRVTAAHRLVLRRGETETGTGTAALPTPPRRHLRLPKQNRPPRRGGAGRGGSFPPLHLCLAAAGPGPKEGGHPVLTADEPPPPAGLRL